MAETIHLGAGQFSISGSATERPPQIHLERCQHTEPTGSDVPDDLPRGERVVTLVFHNVEAVDAFIEALRRTRTWFPTVVDPRHVI